MSTAANSGTGINLSSTFFMRSFYSENRAAFASATRNDYSKTQLSKEDSLALRRAVKKLGTYSFNDVDSTNVRSNVKAFVQTYNNLISSGEDSSNQNISRNTEKLKNLTKEYADALNEVGITVNEDSTMTIRDSSLFADADISKFKSLFSSDSEFMQKSNAYAKKINQYSEDDLYIEKNKTAASGKKDETSVASIVAQSISLENLCNTGVGEKINFTV